MKDSKSKIMSGILVLIIIFLIAALVYFVLQNNKLEKEITSNTTSVSNDNSSSNQENSISIKQALVITDAEQFAYNNELCNNSKSNTIVAYNNSYKLNFKYLGTKKTEDWELCSVIVDDKLNLTFGFPDSSIINIIKTDKYYILEYVAGGVMQYQFEIYDMNGKKVYSEKDCTILFGNSYVEDGIYNYNSFTEIDDQHDRLYHRTIDLNKDVLKSESDIDYIIDKLPQSS